MILRIADEIPNNRPLSFIEEHSSQQANKRILLDSQQAAIPCDDDDHLIQESDDLPTQASSAPLIQDISSSSTVVMGPPIGTTIAVEDVLMRYHNRHREIKNSRLIFIFYF